MLVFQALGVILHALRVVLYSSVNLNQYRRSDEKWQSIPVVKKDDKQEFSGPVDPLSPRVKMPDGSTIHVRNITADLCNAASPSADVDATAQLPLVLVIVFPAADKSRLTYRADGDEYSTEQSQLFCGHSQVSDFLE